MNVVVAVVIQPKSCWQIELSSEPYMTQNTLYSRHTFRAPAGFHFVYPHTKHTQAQYVFGNFLCDLYYRVKDAIVHRNIWNTWNILEQMMNLSPLIYINKHQSTLCTHQVTFNIALFGHILSQLGKSLHQRRVHTVSKRIQMKPE